MTVHWRQPPIILNEGRSGVCSVGRAEGGPSVRKLAAAACLFVVALSVVPRAASQPPTFRSGIDIVNFGVTVVDKKGRLLTDLGEADFEVYEDGRRQALNFFIPCDAQGNRASATGPLPPAALHLGALFDISGSMDADMQLARTASIKFLDSLHDARDYTLVDFDTQVRVTRYSQADFSRLVERIRSRKADGNTALWDAIGVYLDGASGMEGRKILVLYTDGGDNASSLSYPELLNLLKASDVTVHAIGFLEHQSTSVRFDQRSRLQRIAEATGWQAFFPSSVKELTSVYDKVAAEIDAQYTMGYLSANTKTDGAWRKVEIKVVRPGLKDIKVRTRQGYYAPLKK
jgi:Ca-activated chloride channel homolog